MYVFGSKFERLALRERYGLFKRAIPVGFGWLMEITLPSSVVLVRPSATVFGTGFTGLSDIFKSFCSLHCKICLL